MTPELTITILLTIVAFFLAAGTSKNIGATIAATIATAVTSYVVTGVFNYAFQPTTVGAFGGYLWTCGSVLLAAIASAITSALFVTPFRTRSKDKWGDSTYDNDVYFGVGALVAFAAVYLIGFGMIVNGANYIGSTMGDDNVRRLSNGAHITQAAKGQQMPATDPTHLVLTTKDIACFEGQQTIASTGQNLGSKFQINCDDYTLQSIDNAFGHQGPNLYYVAPLSYRNMLNQIDAYDTPGYVVVDAEDPQAGAQLVEKDKLGNDVSIHYAPGLQWDRDITRHLYLGGLRNCNLLDPTLEVDDNLTPWYTLTCADVLNGYDGMVGKSVIVASPRKDGGYKSYPFGKQPAWIDRVVPESEATNYVQWFGLFGFGAGWNNPSGGNQMKPASDAVEVRYDFTKNADGSVSDKPVFVYPMTSTNDNDTSSTGFVLYDTQNLKGTYYPLGGLAVGDPVMHAFQTGEKPLNYDVAGIALYQIYNEPTWVATYQTATSGGAQYQMVGIVDARNLNGANVITGKNIDQVLADYQIWLASGQGTGQHNVTQQANGKTVTGKVARITSATENNQTFFYILFDGDQTHVYRVSAGGDQVSKLIYVAAIGDNVTMEYTVIPGTIVPVDSFTDNTLVPTPAATPTATPSK